MRWHSAISASFVIATLIGCGSTVPALKDSLSENNPLSSSGASLRVSVDVYKGGLGASREKVSEARLAGLINTAKSIFPRFHQSVTHKDVKRFLIPVRGESCSVTFSGGPGLSKQSAPGCETLVGLSLAYDELALTVRNLDAIDKSDILSFTHQASNLASLYARVILEGRGRRDLDEASARRLLAIANSLRFIADQLDVAVNYGNLAAHQIPLSAQLRATSTENFTDLYGWQSLAASRLENFSLAGLFGIFSTSGIRTDRDAAVALKMLDERNYWENINQVYASGQGDFSVALVKDDIGNWNVKHFANDPTELLEAQQKLAINAVELLARSSLPGANEISSAQKVIDFATGSSTTTANFKSDNRIVAELNSLRAEEIAGLFEQLETSSKEWKPLDPLQTSLDKCRSDSLARRDAAIKQQGLAEAERDASQAALDELLEVNSDSANAQGDAVTDDASNATAKEAIAEQLKLRDDSAERLRKLAIAISSEVSACVGPEQALAKEKAGRLAALDSFYNGVRQKLADGMRVLSAVETQHKSAQAESQKPSL